MLFLAVLAGLAGGTQPPAALGQAASGGFPPLPTEKPPPLPAQGAAAQPGKPGPPPAGATGRVLSTGTGFVVASGRALTNHHVIEGCGGGVQIRTAGGRDAAARVVASDRARDLALLEVPTEVGPPLPFRREGSNVRRGEGVVTYGFPLSGILSSGPTLTTGEVSALAGLGDDARQFQISAPVQPGNSGGPLLDMSGNVVGVIVSKLNAQRVAQRTGDIPQNVNFAVKATEAVDFLRSNGVSPRFGDSATRTAPEVGDIAHPSTLFLRCLG
jgi:S1-C subfamily serine protease